MPWDDTARAEHTRKTGRYPSDMLDREWALIAPLLPGSKPGGRPRTTDLRAVMNAILYIGSEGCQWRALPKDFPPVSTVRGSDTAKGFVVLPRRWVVERTFAWLGRCRRLAKDWERTLESSTAWTFLASIRLMTRRIARYCYPS